MTIWLTDKEKDYLEIKAVKGHGIEVTKPLIKWIKESNQKGEHVNPSFVKLKSEFIKYFFYGWKSKRVHNLKIYKKMWKADIIPFHILVKTILK